MYAELGSMALRGLGRDSTLSKMSLEVAMARFEESVRGGSVGRSLNFGEDDDGGLAPVDEEGGESWDRESDRGTASLIHLLGLPGEARAVAVRGVTEAEAAARILDNSFNIPLSRGLYFRISWQRLVTQASRSKSELQQRMWREEDFISMTYAASPDLVALEAGLYSVMTKE
jgi:hypothetical protein